MKLKKKIKKMSAVSQVIAIILLIGLTVLAGAALFFFVLPLLNSQPTIVLDASNPVFASTEQTQLDPFIDTMSFQLTNDVNQPVQIDLNTSYVYNESNNLILYHWTPQVNGTTLNLSGQQGVTLTYKTDAIQNIEELNYGQEVYLKFNATLYGQNNYKLYKSAIFNVSTANSEPIFGISNNNYFNQSGSTVFFSGLPNQTITTDLSIAVWNEGNPTSSHTKTVSLYVENSTFFNVSSQYLTQTVTIPSSNHIGQGGVCYAGDPCVNVNFPITRINLTAMGVNGINASYGAFVIMSGSQFYPYELNITSPRLISLILPDSLVAKGTGNGRIANSNLIYNGPYNANNSLELPITIWNAGNDPISANVYIKGLNTTAFALDSPNVTSVYVPTGTMPSSLNTCNPGDPCTTVTWTITRLPLKNGNVNTGVVAGSYDISVSFLEFVTGLPVVLFINGPGSDASPYIYVNSVTWSKNSNKNQVSSSVEIWDANFNAISGATVTATWQYPSGTTLSLSGTTNSKGIATFTESLFTGTYVLTITNVSNPGNSYQPSLNKISNNQSTYTVTNNYVYINSLTWTNTSAKGNTPSSIDALLTVVDQNNNAISGVLVTIVWNINGVNQTTTVSGTTGNIKSTQGAVDFSISSPTSGAIYRIYVVNVVLANYDYNSALNTNNLTTSNTAP